jgi:hypothetical protein
LLWHWSTDSLLPVDTILALLSFSPAINQTPFGYSVVNLPEDVAWVIHGLKWLGQRLRASQKMSTSQHCRYFQVGVTAESLDRNSERDISGAYLHTM